MPLPVLPAGGVRVAAMIVAPQWLVGPGRRAAGGVVIPLALFAGGPGGRRPAFRCRARYHSCGPGKCRDYQ